MPMIRLRLSTRCSPHRIALVAMGLLALCASAMLPAEDNWPGAAPDCWSKTRVVHGVADYEAQWKDNVRVDLRIGPAIEGGMKSRNGGYQFLTEKSGTETRIRIHVEKPKQVLIRVTHAMSLQDVQWVNEKLLSGRIWWGQVAATDFIFDVESASFVWHQSATESSIAMHQYREGCRQSGGCACIAQTTSE